MPEDTHDPPDTTTAAYVEGLLTGPLPDALSGPGRDKYLRMADKLHGGPYGSPIELIEVMRTGGYRFKARRGTPEYLMIRNGAPVKEHMSFRQISVELEKLTGVVAAHETIRRWVLLFEQSRAEQARPTGRGRGSGRRRGQGGQRAGKTGRTGRQTNPDVPPATFLAPEGGTAQQ